MKWLSSVLGFISEPIKGWQERKTLKVQHKNELEVLVHTAKIEAIKTGQTQDYDLDKIAMQNMNKSWKDEIVLAIFLMPLVLAFFPDYVENVKAGFQAIEQMPTWYMSVIIGMIIVIYGMRGMFKEYLARKAGK